MDSIAPATGGLSAQAMAKNVGALKATMDVQQQMVGQLLQGIAPVATLKTDSAQISADGQALLTKEMGGA